MAQIIDRDGTVRLEGEIVGVSGLPAEWTVGPDGELTIDLGAGDPAIEYTSIRLIAPDTYDAWFPLQCVDENGITRVEMTRAGIAFADAAGNVQNFIASDAVGFFGSSSGQQTGVAVTAAAIHAALVNLGLITA